MSESLSRDVGEINATARGGRRKNKPVAGRECNSLSRLWWLCCISGGSLKGDEKLLELRRRAVVETVGRTSRIGHEEEGNRVSSPRMCGLVLVTSRQRHVSAGLAGSCVGNCFAVGCCCPLVILRLLAQVFVHVPHNFVRKVATACKHKLRQSKRSTRACSHSAKEPDNVDTSDYFSAATSVCEGTELEEVVGSRSDLLAPSTAPTAAERCHEREVWLEYFHTVTADFGFQQLPKSSCCSIRRCSSK
jgi:hypothetical protein